MTHSDYSESCNWCVEEGPKTKLPICWTKMEGDGGQSLELIIKRKDLERSIGDGVFYWGVGNGIPSGIPELLRRTNNSPRVFFSKMPSKSKRRDEDSPSVLLWTKYFDKEKKMQALPCHALVLSAGHKKKYYAIVCHTNETLSRDRLGGLDISHFQNVSINRGKIGDSQVTVIMEHSKPSTRGRFYPINFRARLKSPYYVELAGKVLVSREDRESIRTTVESNPTRDQWRKFTLDLRRRLECS